jgi:D-3-phosphoglycerate dehydrogenase
MAKKVLVSDSLSATGIDILRRAGLDVDVKVGMKPEELKACIGAYHGIAIRSATRLTAEIIAAATNLEVIGRAGSGLDNVDRAAATKKGIVVMNTPGGNTITTAEHTLALMISLARKIPQASASMKAGAWEKKKFMGVELFNKTLGIVGLGQIGGEVARRARALAMQVIAYDPFLSDEKAREMGIEKVSVEDIFRRADFITFHTPLTAETKNIVNRDSIATMKDGVRIVNCARGGIINEADLLEGLNSGKVAGAALDVFEQEPPAPGYALIQHENVIVTPHLGASTGEAQENVAIAVAEQIADYLVHGTIRNAVNFPSIPSDQLAKLAPYIKLAEALGSFATQLSDSSIETVSLAFAGEAANLYTAPITIAALKGLLSPILEETVNFVNAPLIAKDRGIKVEEIRAEAGDYHTMLTLRIRGGDGEHSYSGTLFSRRDPRIILVDNFPVEIIPEGNILAISNNDKPGVIGGIGNLLGSRGINIAWMHFGRESAGGLAMSVVAVDAHIDEDTMTKIRALPNVLSARQVYL